MDLTAALKPGDALVFSDGAEETVVAWPGGSLLVRARPAAGAVNFFLYRHSLCIARLWHGEAEPCDGLARGDLDALGTAAGRALEAAAEKAEAWAGRPGDHTLDHVTAHLAEGEAALEIAPLRLRVTGATAGDVVPKHKAAAAYLPGLLARRPDALAVRQRLGEEEDATNVLLVACPPFPVAPLMVYGPRGRDCAVLREIRR